VEERDFELRDLHARHLSGVPTDGFPTDGAVSAAVDEDEPPVRLDTAGLAAWRGERPVRKESGEIDRSRTLYALACLLARAGATTRTVTAALAERDRSLGLHKYTDRRDGGEQEYRRIARRAVAATTAAPAEELPATDTEQPMTIRQLQAKIHQLQEELADLWQRHRAFLQVLQNRALTAAERQVALAVFVTVAAKASHEDTADGFVRVPLRTVAAQAGCSPQRASVHIGVLESAGVVEKRIERHWVERANPETGEITSQMQSEQYLRFVQPANETLQALTTIAPERPVTTEEQPKPKTWGGQRDSCPEHPDAGTVTRWTKACLVCGQVIDQGEQHTGSGGASLTFQGERSDGDAGRDGLRTDAADDQDQTVDGERPGAETVAAANGALTFHLARSAPDAGAGEEATERVAADVLHAHAEGSDTKVQLHQSVLTVHTMGDHDARLDNGACAGGDQRTRRRDDDG